MRLWKTSYDGDVYLKDVEYSIKYYNNIGYVAKYDNINYVLNKSDNIQKNIKNYFDKYIKGVFAIIYGGKSPEEAFNEINDDDE